MRFSARRRGIRYDTGRWREMTLLATAGLALIIASAAARVAAGGDIWRVGWQECVLVVGYIGAHAALVFRAREADQTLLPIVAMLSGLGWVIVSRLENDVSRNQLVWVLLGLALMSVVVVFGGGLGWLRRYKYTWAVAALALMSFTALFGQEIYGARLWLAIGPLSFQPTEFMKVALVVFMAAYLAEKREILAVGVYRVGPINLPPIPYLAPLGLMWGVSLLILLFQRDLGAMLLLLATALAMVFMATGRVAYVLGGIGVFALNALIGYAAFGYVRARLESWLNPWADPQGQGYQVIQGIVSAAAGGVLGPGIGRGQPDLAPASFTDFVFTAVAEELGLAGAAAVLTAYLALVGRGFTIAARGADPFRQLLAAGLSTMLGLQTLIIVGGNLGLLPLTGITLPFMSYGGSSTVMNFIIVGVLLRLSTRRAEPSGQRFGRTVG